MRRLKSYFGDEQLITYAYTQTVDLDMIIGDFS